MNSERVRENWLPVIVCSILLAATNHLSNSRRIDEVNRFEAKLDAAVSFIGASWGPAEGVAEPEAK